MTSRPIAFVLAAFLSAAGVGAQSSEEGLGLAELSFDEISLTELAGYKDALARDVARELSRPAFRDLVESRLTALSPAAPLVTMLKDYAETLPSEEGRLLHERVAALDLGIRRAKGVETRLTEILQLRLADPFRALKGATAPLVAYAPAGDDRTWTHIPAYAPSGRRVRLDPRQEPRRPLLVAGLDARADLRAGLALLNESLVAAGIQPDLATTMSRMPQGVPTSKLTRIWMADDHEPWIKGAAEIYALVAGVDPDRDRASIAAVEMPYLDHDNTTYYPNQVIVFWSNYRFAAADILFYEHDDSTNYQTIASGLLQAVGTFVPTYGWAFTLAAKIIDLMPSSWFSDDDDYCDVFYTLERDHTYTDYRGVSNNVRLSLVPYTLNP